MAGRKTPGQKKKTAAPAATPEVVCKPEGGGIVSKSGGGRVGAVVRARDAEREDGIDMAGIIGRAMMDQIPPEVMKRIAGYVEKGEKAVDDVVDYARQELTGPATEAGSYLKEAAGVAERGITGLAGQAGDYLENRDAGQVIDDLVDYGRQELTGPGRRWPVVISSRASPRPETMAARSSLAQQPLQAAISRRGSPGLAT